MHFFPRTLNESDSSRRAGALSAGLHTGALAPLEALGGSQQSAPVDLHVSYAWIPLGFLLLGLSAVGVVTLSAALHAFGVGATGGLIAAMTTRSARGHTGRALTAEGAERAMYVLVQIAAASRVLAALGVQTWPLLVASALAWSLAFGIFFVRYAPWLMRPRLDGERG